MMMAAIETCWSSTPNGPMKAKANETAKGTMDATTSASRQPRNRSMTRSTTAKVCAMLTSAPLTDASTTSGWKVEKVASMPMG